MRKLRQTRPFQTRLLVQRWCQGPRQKKKEKSAETVVVVAEDDKDDLFVFTCTSDYVAVADALEVLKSKLGTCMDSGASRHYCLDQTKFTDYKAVECKITTANGRTLTTACVGDLYIDLPNGSEKTKTILKGAVHAPDMAFTLISISWLDKAGFSVLFNKGMHQTKRSLPSPTATDCTKLPLISKQFKVNQQMWYLEKWRSVKPIGSSDMYRMVP
jgi:hypothetical protein